MLSDKIAPEITLHGIHNDSLSQGLLQNHNVNTYPAKLFLHHNLKFKKRQDGCIAT